MVLCAFCIIFCLRLRKSLSLYRCLSICLIHTFCSLRMWFASMLFQSCLCMSPRVLPRFLFIQPSALVCWQVNMISITHVLDSMQNHITFSFDFICISEFLFVFIPSCDELPLLLDLMFFIDLQIKSRSWWRSSKWILLLFDNYFSCLVARKLRGLFLLVGCFCQWSNWLLAISSSLLFS